MALLSLISLMFVVFGVVFLHLSQKIVKYITNRFYDKIEKVRKEDFGEAIKVKQKDKSGKLGFITSIVGRIESIFFAVLTIILFENYSSFLEGLIVFLKALAAWLGIKTLGNYQQWSDPNWGRSYFYVYLIGTLMSIVLAVIYGFIFLILITVFDKYKNIL